MSSCIIWSIGHNHGHIIMTSWLSMLNNLYLIMVNSKVCALLYMNMLLVNISYLSVYKCYTLDSTRLISMERGLARIWLAVLGIILRSRTRLNNQPITSSPCSCGIYLFQRVHCLISCNLLASRRNMYNTWPSDRIKVKSMMPIRPSGVTLLGSRYNN
jgi:hypothetical protein